MHEVSDKADAQHERNAAREVGSHKEESQLWESPIRGGIEHIDAELHCSFINVWLCQPATQGQRLKVESPTRVGAGRGKRTASRAPTVYTARSTPIAAMTVLSWAGRSGGALRCGFVAVFKVNVVVKGHTFSSLWAGTAPALFLFPEATLFFN